MSEAIELFEFFHALTAIIVISFFVTIAWMSTYVRDQPVVATAVVVFPQDSSISSSATRTQNMNTEPRETTVPPSEDVAHTSDEEPLISSNIAKKPAESKELSSPKCTPISESKEPEKESKSEASGQSNSSNEIYTEVSESSTKDFCSNNESNQDSKQEGLLPEKSRQQKSEKTEEETITHSSKSGSCNSTSEVNAEPDEAFSPESIRIKLRFVDDTQRLVRGSLTDEVGIFKRANFDTEISSNRAIRLIFNGQLLNRDRSTLGQYGLFDNCVVHCHISQPQPLDSNERSNPREYEGLDLSEILSPMLLVIMAVLWYLRYEYSHIFNTSATIILVFLTALLLVSQFAFTVNLELSFGYRNNGNDRRTIPASSAPATGPRATIGGTESRIERHSETPSTPPVNRIKLDSSQTESNRTVAESSSETESRIESHSDTITPYTPPVRNVAGVSDVGEDLLFDQPSDNEPVVSASGNIGKTLTHVT